ncbi:Hsp70 family protein [Marispirochaeta sp.]|uniref:Hsp70 family protein n=1 Tax=Marispirochaeta sp. TaxID=2038653 RepID=UPI0029C988BB|nr:Hsp70 family protein [Marispirochaeta sp.]
MVVGIDFGTANTSVAILDGNRPKVILDQYGSSRLPVPGADGCTSSLDRAVLLFRQNKKHAEKLTGHSANTAVLAIPVNVPDSHRRKLVEAGKMAGFLDVKLLNQPLATVLSMRNSLSGKILVLDIGERTCKSALLYVHADRVELQSSIMDDSLGGSRFTRDICSLIQKKAGLNSDLTGSVSFSELKGIAENLKKGLSVEEEVTVSLLGEPVTVTRREYENNISPKIKRLQNMVERLLGSSEIVSSQIDTILLAGGGTHTPCIRSSIRRIFPESVSIRMCPAESIALGAAGLFSHTQCLRRKKMDLAPCDFGLEIDRGKSFWMLRKDTPLPGSAKRTFTTVTDNQNRVEIHIVQGNVQKTKSLVSLRRFSVENIPSAPQGRPRINIQFFLSRNGLLTINIHGPSGEVSETVRITAERTGYKPEQNLGNDINTLISRVEREYKGRRFFIDPEFSEDINDILEIARSGKSLINPGVKRECTIALWSILKEMESTGENREAGCAG